MFSWEEKEGSSISWENEWVGQEGEAKWAGKSQAGGREPTKARQEGLGETPRPCSQISFRQRLRTRLETWSGSTYGTAHKFGWGNHWVRSNRPVFCFVLFFVINVIRYSDSTLHNWETHFLSCLEHWRLEPQSWELPGELSSGKGTWSPKVHTVFWRWHPVLADAGVPRPGLVASLGDICEGSFLSRSSRWCEMHDCHKLTSFWWLCTEPRCLCPPQCSRESFQVNSLCTMLPVSVPLQKDQTSCHFLRNLHHS